MAISIILADDHGIVLDGLQALLRQTEEFDIVAVCKSGRETLSATEKHKPDIVVLDISMPDIDGVECTTRIRRLGLDAKVIALSMHTERAVVAAVLRAGAVGYIPKDAAARELTQAIREVVSHGCYLSASVSNPLLFDMLENSNGRDLFEALTPRERDVVRLVSEGLTTKEIARKLELSRRTVEAHRQRVMQKLGLRHTVELVRFALRAGLAWL